MSPAAFKPVNEVADAAAAKKLRQAFYTPLSLVERMVEWSEVLPSMRVLEPSAGDGRIVHALLATGIEAVDFCEVDGPLSERVAGYGGNCVGSDFLKLKPAAPYDRVVMNPPFAGKTWAKHVEHAWSLLAPGGRVVAIVPNVADRHLGDEKANLPGCEHAECEQLDGSWFAEYGTNVRVAVVTLHKARANEPRAHDGFANWITWNYAVSANSDEPLYRLARRPGVAIEEFRRRCVQTFLSVGMTPYGVAWPEVLSYVRGDHELSDDELAAAEPDTQLAAA